MLFTYKGDGSKPDARPEFLHWLCVKEFGLLGGVSLNWSVVWIRDDFFRWNRGDPKKDILKLFNFTRHGWWVVPDVGLVGGALDKIVWDNIGLFVVEADDDDVNTGLPQVILSTVFKPSKRGFLISDLRRGFSRVEYLTVCPFISDCTFVVPLVVCVFSRDILLTLRLLLGEEVDPDFWPDIGDWAGDCRDGTSFEFWCITVCLDWDFRGGDDEWANELHFFRIDWTPPLIGDEGAVLGELDECIWSNNGEFKSFSCSLWIVFTEFELFCTSFIDCVC